MGLSACPHLGEALARITSKFSAHRVKISFLPEITVHRISFTGEHYAKMISDKDYTNMHINLDGISETTMRASICPIDMFVCFS